jgi:thymidylate synthase (FAD)
MHTTKIGIFKIAQTRVNWAAVAAWLEFIGVKEVGDVLQQIAAPSIAGKVDSIADLPNWQLQKLKDCPATDASALIALCGKRCYQSFEVGQNPNVSKIRTDHAAYITNVLASGHGSVLEHATWSFAIENVSRVFTREMNRHRAGVAISEGSMRYIRFDDVGFTMPDSILGSLEDSVAAEDQSQVSIGTLMEFTEPGEKKRRTREIFESAFKTMEKWNLDLCNIWKIGEMKDFTQKKKLTSMFRRIIGMGVSTGGIWTLNARSLRHVLAMRGSEYAEEEIYHVFDRIAQIMIEDEPLLFGDFTKNDNGGWIPLYPKV